MEAIVRLIDRSAGESDSKRGDVVTVQADGWNWSTEERTNPDWIIIKITSLLDTDRATMIQVGQNFPFGRFRRREWFVDFTQLALPSRFDWPRKQESVTVLRAAFIGALTQKPPLV